MKIGVISGEKSLSYGDLDAISDRIAGILKAKGVKRGDRVGIFVPKSFASILSVFGILKAGGVYVPLDPGAPANRLAYLIKDCGMRALLTNSMKVAALHEMIPENRPVETVLLIDPDGPEEKQPMDTRGLNISRLVQWREVLEYTHEASSAEPSVELDRAYILYTSGSTGSPKGVMISHRNSLTFVNWAAECVGLSSGDVVSSFAPLHFDLSTFDIFSSISAGATIVLVPEGTSTFPVMLAELIEKKRITVWYSVPSVLTFLVQYGNLAARDLASLRAIVFAGEVFPVKYLRKLMDVVPGARYYNWYGPTETNVCTFYEVKELDPERTPAIPIGKACANTDVFALTKEGKKLNLPGESGELYVRGPSVMLGYWGDVAKTSRALVINPLHPETSELVYKTGDMVTLDSEGNYLYVGRQDHMVKTRGYRVELGEVETILYKHPLVGEAAVMAVPDDLVGNRLRAVISPIKDGHLTKEEVLSFCAKWLPNYMIPDIVEFRETLPKTSTGKTDRTSLAADPA